MNAMETNENHEELWYKDGLRFECQVCGSCCTGEPGYVWVSPDEIEALAEELGVDAFYFEERCVKKVGNRKSLIDLPNGDCILFDHIHRKCKVYKSRPTQCRTWPFWESNIETEEAWRNTSRQCPGCNRGRLVPLEEIILQRDERRL